MPAGMEDVSLDPRMQETATTAKRRLDCLAKISSLTVDSGYQAIYGECKSLKFMSVDIPTDTDYQFDLIDIDGEVIYTNASISDVAVVWVNLANDDILMLNGMYKGRWTWTTARVIVALDYQVLLIFQ